MSKDRVSHSGGDLWMHDSGKYGHHNVENHKRRRALPPLPSLTGSYKFFDRLLNVRKAQDLVFITKAAAKNR